MLDSIFQGFKPVTFGCNWPSEMTNKADRITQFALQVLQGVSEAFCQTSSYIFAPLSRGLEGLQNCMKDPISRFFHAVHYLSDGISNGLKFANCNPGSDLTSNDQKSDLEKALRNKDEKGIKEWLTLHKTMSSEELEKVLENVSFNVKLSTLQLLLSDGRKLSQEALPRVLRAFLNKDAESIVRFLLPLINPLAEDLFNSLIFKSANRGWEDILDSLLKRGPVAKEVRDLAMQSARNSSICNKLKEARLIHKKSFHS